MTRPAAPHPARPARPVPARAAGARAAPAALALAAAGAAWAMPWEGWLGAHFPAHMIRHMLLVAVAPPLVVAVLARAAPRVLQRIALAPLAGAVVEFLVVWAWHLPAPHLSAAGSAGWFAAEQAAFLAAGLAVWAGALGAAQPLAGAGALLLTSMHMTLLGALILLAPVPLYPGLDASGATPLDAAGAMAPDAAGAMPLHAAGAMPLEAQRLGGILMLAIGTPAYLLGGLWLVARALRDPAAPDPPA